MQILVVDCLTAGEGKRRFSRDFIAAAPRLIAGFIEQLTHHNIPVQIFRGEDLLQAKNYPLSEKSPILCVSAMTMDIGIVKQVFRLWISKAPPNHLAILGGPITTDPNILKQIPFDIAVLGEGEDALAQIFRDPHNILKCTIPWDKLTLDQIPHIQYRLGTEILSTAILQNKGSWFETTTGFPEKIKFYPEFEQARIHVECVRGCSNYRRTALPLSEKGKDILCQSSKSPSTGCNVCGDFSKSPLLNCPVGVPPGCGFCSCIDQFGSSRSRNIEPIITEIKALIQMGARRIVLGGPDFLDFQREKLVKGPLIDPRFPEPNYDALNALIVPLIEHPLIRSHEVQLFIENIKPSLCTNRALDILARIPNPIFSIGCETGSKLFARQLGRPCEPNDTLDVIKRAMERNIRIHVYFIHSLPGDNAEYVQDTLALMQKMDTLGVEKITLYRYQELPGSPFFNIKPALKQFSKKDLHAFEKIKRFVIYYNGQQKQKLVGSVISVFISEINTQQRSDAIGWLLEGGPKISVRNGVKFIGQVKKVHVDRVISDRLIEGSIQE